MMNPLATTDRRCRSAVALLIAAVVLGPAFGSAAEVSDQRLAELDRFWDVQYDQFRLPGLAAAVVDANGTAHIKIRGTGISNDSAFLIGSCSKSITALTALLVLEQKSVELDRAVSDLLPNLEFVGHERSVRIRDLLQHRSGLTRRQGFDDLPTLQELEANRWQLHPAKPPGEEFAYCNLNYSVLGLVIEELTGLPFPDAARTYVFQPLSMDHSYAGAAPEKAPVAPEHRCMFGFAQQVPPTQVKPSRVPSGFVRCSIDDLARFVSCLMNDGLMDGQQVFPAELIRRMRTPKDDEFGYGMGLNCGYFDPVGSVIGHEGATGTAYAAFAFFPDQQLGLVFVTNVNLFDPLTDSGSAIFKSAVRMLGGDEPLAVRPYRLWIRYALIIAGVLTVFQTGRALARWFATGASLRIPSDAAGRLGLLATFAVPVMIWALVLWWTQIPLRHVLRIEPDVMWTLLALTGLGMVRGVIDQCGPSVGRTPDVKDAKSDHD